MPTDDHRDRPTTFEIVSNDRVAPAVHRLVVRAPRIATVRRPGQFVIVHLGPGSERIPLTVADADPTSGTITLFVQAVGKSTADLVAVPAGGTIHDVAGPLGHPTELVTPGAAVCVGGGVGAAVIHPIARALHDAGVTVTSVLGARSRDWLILEAELARWGEVIVCTDDGTAGRHGFVTDALGDVLRERGAGAGAPIDAVYAAGPVPMMRAVAATTAPFAVRTVVSLNPIMIDGTGMCGGCRVTVAGSMKFACIDGPEFDAHEVDFDELADRLTTYRDFERRAASSVASVGPIGTRP